MKKEFLTSWIITCVIISAACLPVKGALVNGSFEDGLNGWTVQLKNVIVRDNETLQPIAYPYPTEQIPWQQFWGVSSSFVDKLEIDTLTREIITPLSRQGPVDGQFFAAAGNPRSGFSSGFTGPDNQSYYLQYTPKTQFILSQTVDLRRGETLSGWAAYFYENTVGGRGSGDAKISVGQQQVWFHNEDTAYRLYGSGWEKWEYLAPTDGRYEIEILLGTPYADDYAFAAFDNFTVSTVTDPHSLKVSAFLLLPFGLQGIGFLRSRYKHSAW